MARISLDPPQTPAYRLGARFSRRRYGVMLDPGAAIGHNMQVGRAYAIFELQVERWHQLDHGLKDAEAMTATPPEVTDGMVAALREHLTESQLVELTAIIAVENLRSRVNSAFGLTAQGFRDRCELPSPASGAGPR
jgi:hypothetical protein